MGGARGANPEAQTKDRGRLRVLVTGGGGGIGAAVAARYVRGGAWVCAVDKRPVSEWAAPCGGLCIVADLTEMGAADRVADAVSTAVEGLDILVNAAGTFLPDDGASWFQVGETLWRDNVLTAATTARACVALLSRGRSPLIVNLSSTDGVVASAAQDTELGVTHDALYAAAKGGVLALTRALAMKWAPLGIRVNAICPTIVPSPMTQSLLCQEGKCEELAARLPLRRLCKATDVAIAVEALYSMAVTTGHMLPLDSGYLCR